MSLVVVIQENNDQSLLLFENDNKSFSLFEMGEINKPSNIYLNH